MASAQALQTAEVSDGTAICRAATPRRKHTDVHWSVSKSSPCRRSPLSLDMVCMAAESPPLVVVLDSDPDTTEMLQMALDAAGFAVVTGNLHEFRTGEEDLLAFLERTDPDVILYDLSPPYEKNWAYLETMRQHPAFARPALVITTTNQRAVQKLVSLPVVEIFAKPYDLDVLTSAVRTALTARTEGDGEDRRRGGERRTGDDRRSPGDRRARGPTD